MSALKDILDILKDADTIGNIEKFFKNKKYSSISKRSLEGTLQFPVLVSRSMDIDTLQMITKALEREFSSFVQVVLSMNPVLDLKKQKDLTAYLKQFHQNSDVKTDLKDVMNVGINILADNYNCYTNETETTLLFSAVYEGATGKLISDNKEQLHSVIEQFKTDVLNNKFIPAKNIHIFKNNSLSQYHNSLDIVKEGRDLKDTEFEKQRFEYQKKKDAELNNLNSDKFEYQKEKDAAQLKIERDKLKPKTKDMDISMIQGGKMLTDNDVKKSNELVPTTLHVRLKFIGKDDTDVGFFDFIIGVKATMHPINSDEMVTNLINGAKNNNKFFDFIRWTSGEIGFIKDFVLNIKEMKSDVVNRSDGSTGWWISLKRRKALSKLRNNLFMSGSILPNATIVLSMEEVEYIKTNYGYDLMSSVFVDKLMETYFLLGFVVVDNSTQIAHFMFDGQKNFQSVSFNGLERENSNRSDFKEIYKMINTNRL